MWWYAATSGAPAGLSLAVAPAPDAWLLRVAGNKSLPASSPSSLPPPPPKPVPGFMIMVGISVHGLVLGSCPSSSGACLPQHSCLPMRKLLNPADCYVFTDLNGYVGS